MEKIQAFLKQKLEGGLFAYLSVKIFGNEVSTQIAYYTVLNGKVYELSKDGTLTNSKEDLLSVESTCFKVGEYEHGKAYPIKTTICSFQQFLNKNKLN
jgi:hypothetical protein